MATTASLTRAARLLEAGVAAVVIVLVVIGGSVSLLTTPPYVRLLVRAVNSAELTGLGEQTTLEVAEGVRRFVVDPGAPALPSTIDGTPAFNDAAVEHLVDVRDVMVPARWLTLSLFALTAVWTLVRRRTPSGRRTLAHASAAAATIMLGGAALAVAAGAFDFNALFAWFHSLFFAEGTWVFPYEALLIRVFPLPFWIAAGATWGALVLIAAAALCLFVRRLRFTAGAYGV
ncbi:MAG: lipoprotein intramolecular transacylase Lit [Coriobacteriia bacterium]